jgi:hypothetical protein
VPYSDCTRDNPLAHTVLEMGYGQQELAAAVAAEGLRPTLRPDAPPRLAELLCACWDREPSKRPPAAEVAATLQELAACLEASAAAHTGTSAENVSRSAECTLADAPPLAAAATGEPPDNSAQASHVLKAAKTAPPAPGGLPPWLAADGAAAPSVFCGSFLTAGKRDKMEDYIMVLDDCFGDAGAPGCTILGVFDGHRYEPMPTLRVFVRQSMLPRNLADQPQLPTTLPA